MELKKHGSFKLLVVLTFSAVLAACSTRPGDQSSFQFHEDENGVSLTENGEPVFYYRQAPKTLNEGYVCNHYIHPLYAPNGDTLTEESPVDHPYHRGIFWSWHQFYIDSMSLGDEWIMDKISHEVTGIQTASTQNEATIELDVSWKSELLENGKPYMKENTRIVVHPLKEGIRRIDFEISLQALVPGLSIGGSDDEKGYGGFCARLKLPDDLSFNSDNKAVEPKNLQVRAGSWMNFTGTFGASSQKNGVAICCHPSTPNYPAPWILRQKGSMQNIVFPGRERVAISMDQPTVLRYRLIVHEGSSGEIDMAGLQAEFEEIVFN